MQTNNALCILQCQFSDEVRTENHWANTHHKAQINPQANQCTLVFQTDCTSQDLRCPHRSCKFISKRVETTRHIAKHFTKQHKKSELVIQYHCQQCRVFMDSDERYAHRKAHATASQPGQVFSPPIPIIDPATDELSLVASPDQSLTYDRHEHSLLTSQSPMKLDIKLLSPQESFRLTSPKKTSEPMATRQLDHSPLNPLATPFTPSSPLIQPALQPGQVFSPPIPLINPATD